MENMDNHPTSQNLARQILAAGSAESAQLSRVRTALVCGTDFSNAATEVAQAAAALARRLGERLVLVHALNEHSHQGLPDELREVLIRVERERLHELQEQLGPQNGTMIETSFRIGRPDAVILEEAAAQHARLLVIAGSKQPSVFGAIGSSVSERVAESARVPTLVVNDATSLLRWASGGHCVRVLVGVDGSAASIAALHWVDWFRRIWPCELIVDCLETHPTGNHCRETFPSLFMGEMALKTAHVRERRFREHIRALFGTADVQVRYETGPAHCEGHLIYLAREERADLIVVGTHSRSGWARLLHHSVSRGVLHAASCNVVCVPEPNRETAEPDSQFVCKPYVRAAYEN